MKDQLGNSTLVYVPTSINKSDIQSINPFFSSKGRVFKNVSTIETYSNKIYSVAENYKKLNERIRPTIIKGFKK